MSDMCNVTESEPNSNRRRYNTRSSGRRRSQSRSSSRASGCCRCPRPCPCPPPPLAPPLVPPPPPPPNGPEPNPPVEVGINKRGWCYWCFSLFCTLLKTILYLAIIGVTSYTLWSYLEMDARLKDLEKVKVQARSPSSKGVDPQEKIFKEMNKKYSDALKRLLQDPVNRPDFALESSGGRVISTDTLPYDSEKKFFGFWVCEGSAHTPSAMIRPWFVPGECWAFRGQKGSAVIQLIALVNIDGVTLEHIPVTLAPTGKIDSAPKKFKLWGLADLQRTSKKTLLGEFEYEIGGTTLQTFAVSTNNTQFYQYVEFEVLSNHGNKDFTCVYRLRVHGRLMGNN